MLKFANIKEVVIPENGTPTQVVAIFDKNDTLMWRKKYSVDNFRLTNIDKSDSVQVTLTNDYAFQQYSIDEGATWNSFTGDEYGRTQTVVLRPGNSVIFRITTDVSYDRTSKFSMVGNGKVIASGEVMSLRRVNYEGNIDPVKFDSLFKGCTQLVIADFILPSTLCVEVSQRIWNYGSYDSMFAGCTSLKWVPTGMLPTTVLSPNCYRMMFDGCSSLKQAPYLLGYPKYDSDSQTHATGFYYRMFNACSSLDYLKCTLPEYGLTEYTGNCNQMLADVASTGKLVKNSDVDESLWRSGYVGTISGWTISNY